MFHPKEDCIACTFIVVVNIFSTRDVIRPIWIESHLSWQLIIKDIACFFLSLFIQFSELIQKINYNICSSQGLLFFKLNSFVRMLLIGVLVTTFSFNREQVLLLRLYVAY